MENKDKDATVKIYLPSELRARFKAKCALEERSMNEVLLAFIQEFVDEPTLKANGKTVSISSVTHE